MKKLDFIVTRASFAKSIGSKSGYYHTISLANFATTKFR
jgi:hypothetical protein